MARIKSTTPGAIEIRRCTSNIAALIRAMFVSLSRTQRAGEPAFGRAADDGPPQSSERLSTNVSDAARHLEARPDIGIEQRLNQYDSAYGAAEA
ncbi:MAG TPA: hypothetical protein VF210_21410 [Pseudomonadales bacterium]